MRKCVCVVDGDAAVRDAAYTLLDLAGYCVHTFGGLNPLHAAGLPPETGVVICEAELPDGAGLNLHRSLKASRALPAFVLIMSTANPRLAAHAALLGVDRVLVKPLVDVELVQLVHTYCHDRARSTVF